MKQKKKALSKARLLLIQSPNDLLETQEDWNYSLAHASLAAVVAEAGHEVDALHFIKQDWSSIESELIRKLKLFKPTHIGISILTDCRVNAHKICAIVKSFNPEIEIIVGGVHASFMWKQTLEDFNIDYVVIGEGEETILELLAGKNAFEIKGLALRMLRCGMTGCISIKNEPRQRTFKLDKYPIPRHDLFIDIIREKGIAHMVTGRGCVNHPGCTFCCGQAYWQGCLVQRSAEKVVEEIEFLVKLEPLLQEIIFLDDEFLCNKIRVRKIFDILDKRNIKFKWVCSARASSLDEDFVRYIKEHGCYNVHIGVESFSQQILDGANKNIKVDRMQEAIKLCRKNGLDVTLMCITGLPGETAATVNESIQGAKAIGEAINTAILLVYPGTQVYELAKQKGLIDDGYWIGDRLAPLYTAEHSKARLIWWSYKTAIITHWHAGKLGIFIGNKLRLNRLGTLINKFIGTRSR